MTNIECPPPRLVVAGTGSNCGKTTVSSALMAAFTSLGKAVYPCKVGPDFIDPSFHKFVTGLPSCSLDSWLLHEDTVTHLFLRHTQQCNTNSLAIIEGVMGFFDGMGTSSIGSTAHVAKILNAPTLLVVDGQGMSLSVAALVSGYATFNPEYPVSGVIFNRLSGTKHYELLSRIIENELGIPCYGFLPRNKDIVFARRHLGLIPSYEVQDLNNRIDLLTHLAKETIDLLGLEKLAKQAPSLSIPTQEKVIELRSFDETPKSNSLPAQCDTVQEETLQHNVLKGNSLAMRCDTSKAVVRPKVRIGVFKDKAFSFYYPDNLKLLQECGAELVYLSPLSDKKIPSGLGGLYIGGGFPEVFAQELCVNVSFREHLCEKLESGLFAYAECGGQMYLMDEIIQCEGKSAAMVGFFSGQAVMTKRMGNFGYITVTTKEQTVLGPAGLCVRAHEFHHSRLESSVPLIAEMHKDNSKGWSGGLCKKNVLAWYPHLHFYSMPQVARHFVMQCANATL